MERMMGQRALRRHQQHANLPFGNKTQSVAMCDRYLTDSPAMRLALFLTIAIAFYCRPVNAQTTSDDTVKVSVGTGRPVAKAVEELVSRYGYVITYEDPLLSYEGDWEDVTTQVRRDLDKYPPGAAPKVMVPRGGTLNLTLPSAHSISADTMASLLEQVVRNQAHTRQGGHFRVERDGEIFHVIPSEARDQTGNWTPQAPLLDALISLPSEDRRRMATLPAITNALTAAVGVTVDMPFMGGIEAAEPRLYRFGAKNERARDVLMRALDLIGSPATRTTWLMFCDKLMCAISLENVPAVARLEVTTP
jgi:hypothetical protein